jgi:hypothetical protein
MALIKSSLIKIINTVQLTTLIHERNLIKLPVPQWLGSFYTAWTWSYHMKFPSLRNTIIVPASCPIHTFYHRGPSWWCKCQYRSDPLSYLHDLWPCEHSDLWEDPTVE